jgi:hypothetical protein
MSPSSSMKMHRGRSKNSLRRWLRPASILSSLAASGGATRARLKSPIIKGYGAPFRIKPRTDEAQASANLCTFCRMIRDCRSSIGKAADRRIRCWGRQFVAPQLRREHWSRSPSWFGRARVNRDRRPWTGCSDSCESDDGGRRALRIRGVDAMLAIVEQEQQVLVAHSDDHGWERVVRSNLQLWGGSQRPVMRPGFQPPPD